MRIENQTNRNNSNAFQKKNKVKKLAKEQEVLSEYSDQLELSSGILLLNRLLEAPEHQYIPLPFYFPNAAKRNAQQASSIAKSIQKKAISHDTNFNYDMVLDLVLSHSQEITHQIRLSNNLSMNQVAAYQSLSLQNNEAIIFETLHHKSKEQNLPLELISAIAVEYSQHIQNKKLLISSQTEQIQLLLWLVKNSRNSTISNKQKSLMSILEKIISQLKSQTTTNNPN